MEVPGMPSLTTRKRSWSVGALVAVARLGIEQLGSRALAITLLAVAQETLQLVHGLARVGVPRLRPREARQAHERGGHDPESNVRHWPSPSVAAAGRSHRTDT